MLLPPPNNEHELIPTSQRERYPYRDERREPYDANQAHKEMTKDVKVHKEKLSQSGDLTRGRIEQGQEHLKFFLLVFLMFRKML